MSQIAQILLLTLPFVAQFSFGQVEFSPQDETDKQVAILEQRLEELTSKNDFEPNTGNQEARSKLEDNLNKARKLQNLIESLNTEIGNAETNSLELTATLTKFRDSKVDFSQFKNLDVSGLETRLRELRGQIERDTSQFKNLESERKQRADSKIQFQENLDKNNETIGKIQAELANLAAASDGTHQLSKLVRESELLLLTTTNSFLRVQLHAIDIDQQFSLTSQKLELIELRLARNRDLEAFLTNEISVSKQEAAADQAKAASESAEKASSKFPWLAESEKVNVELANRIRDGSEELSKEERLLTQLDRQINELELEISRTKNTISERSRAAANSSSVGAILRKLKAKLPSEQASLQSASVARKIVEDLQFEKLEIDNRIDELSIDLIRSELELAGVESITSKLEGYPDAVATLIDKRRSYLNDFRKAIDERIENQFHIESASLSMARAVREFSNYINERILWIRSNKFLFTELSFDKKDQDLISKSCWSDVPSLALERIKRHPFYFSNILIFVFILFAVRPRLRRRVDEFGEVARRGSCATFWPTAWSSVMSTLIAITIPVTVAGIGWGLSRDLPSDRRLYDALSQSVFLAGLFSIPFAVLRRICRPEGLAICHFDWSEYSVTKLQKELKWFVFPASLAVFVVSVFVILGKSHQVDLLERIIFAGSMFLSGILLHRVFNVRSGIFSQYLKRNEGSWASQTSYVWITCILFIPISLAVLSTVGYYYTALKLTRYLVFTSAFALGIELTRALVRRFVLVRRRHAHIEKSKRQREAEIAAEKEAIKKAAAERKRRIAAGEEVAESTKSVTSVESLTELQFDSIDIDQNAGHANQLIKLLATGAWVLGLWLIWSDALPALKALDEYTLWGEEVVFDSVAQTQSGMALTGSSSNGSPTDSIEGTVEIRRPESKSETYYADGRVSIRDLIVFFAIVLVTFFAARNLPNTIEMLFLDELPVDRSARLATKSLFSYAIILVGVMLGLRTLSIDWSSIQWLVTALTFGLAFGLQEIFANFVAGIILMFERPMRIGDLITVDDFTGVVTRIRTRATTIVNWDRKEYIIPNKDFITGRLVNWTLSDAINRVQFTVGVAYGSDVTEAKRIIFNICKEHECIMDDPPTSITFEEFADSSLNLVIRTFLGEVDSRLVVIDELHTRINSAFNEAGIEIAFPQRDLHIRTCEDGVIGRPKPAS